MTTDSGSACAQHVLELKRTLMSAQPTVLRWLRQQGVEWEEQPAAFKYGAFVKKERYDKHSINPRTKKPVVAKRTRLATRALKLDGHNQKNVGMLFAKFWNDVA